MRPGPPDHEKQGSVEKRPIHLRFSLLQFLVFAAIVAICVYAANTTYSALTRFDREVARWDEFGFHASNYGDDAPIVDTLIAVPERFRPENLPAVFDNEDVDILVLKNTEVGDRDLAELWRIPKLMSLHLINTHVTDAGIPDLLKCQKLAILLLDGTSITDACLPVLGHMKQLKELGIEGTKISDQGAEWLRNQLPTTRVFYEDGL